MDDDRIIPFNFTYFAMKLLGKNLYSTPWTAVSEIVANGIDAGAKNVYVLVDMRNKEKAIVEIFDDGSGMTFDDLKQKYTLIGRNKRLEDDNREGKTLGRKGIGKLAALYLSPCYYIYTKTGEDQSAWVVNTQGILDSEVPALIHTPYNTEMLVSKESWSQLQTGTMIHLSDVDLRKIGSERLKSLPVMLADYYLETVISSIISVCIINNNNDEIKFNKIVKDIGFKTMYGIFDNTGLGYKDKIPPRVYITKDSVYPEVDYPRNTVKLDESKYACSGTISMTDLHGNTKDLAYKMIGWIGIHSSLDNAILLRNDKNGKRIQNHTNALRLYVRGKLAVNNLMNYVASTAAFASYVEGEVSFDILDNDMFEDASTSNREGYSINDPRIKKLIEIVGKIISTLVVERNKAGNKVNEEIKTIKEKQEAIAEEERKKREEAEEQTRKEKERAEKASEEKKRAETERDEAKEETSVAHERLFVLENNFKSDGEKYKHAMHLSVNFAKEIRSLTCDIGSDDLNNKVKVISTIMEIDRSAAKIECLPDYVDAVTFSLTSPTIKINIIELIQQYMEAKGSKRLKYNFNISYSIVKEVDFTEILMLVENIISNSIKFHASEIHVESTNVNGKCQIDFTDNGSGLNKKYTTNPQAIFALGETTTYGGYGIGAFHMKEIVEKLGGEILAIPETPNGLTIRVVL